MSVTPYFRFELLWKSKKEGSRARVGRIHTPHGSFLTPSFVPVATNAAIKGILPSDLQKIFQRNSNPEEAGLSFCNTYHLILHPGSDVVQKAGGLHQFMNHKHPLITDSGGFQVFSLAYGSVHEELTSKGKKLANADIFADNETDQNTGVKSRRRFAGTGSNMVKKITEDGVLFTSYRNGSKILLTPESSIIAQKQLGADIIIPFDELPPYHISDAGLAESLERTHRWEIRSLNEHLKDPKQQAMYAVIHGGMNWALREHSVKFLSSFPFDGFAIGGSLGKSRDDVVKVSDFVTKLLHEDKPTHLLGIGDLECIENCIPHGIDTFDSSFPTRCARHGQLFTRKGKISISRAKYKECFEPADSECSCDLCQKYSLAYLYHLFKTREPTFVQLSVQHNLTFYYDLMERKRKQILNSEI